MKKRILSLLTALALCLTLLPVPVLAAENSLPVTGIPWSGSGTEADPYQINTIGDLQQLAANVNGGNTYQGKYFKLTADVMLNDKVLKEDGTPNGSNFTSWTPIGNESNAFEGTFDGGGHTVSGLYFSNESTDYVGLFGRISTCGTIKNVGVVDSYLRGYHFVGGVCGDNGGTITNCYNTGAVSGNDSVGGVCGQKGMDRTVENCYNTGTVSGSSSVGGVCGYASLGGSFTNCYNIGTVSGSSSVGGMCGHNGGVITNCYNIGTVTGSETYVGGVCGFNDEDCTITNCYFLNTSCDTPGGGTSKTKDEFKNITDLSGFESNVWMPSPLGRPVLKSNAEGGTGTAEDPFRIGTKEELKNFAAMVNSGSTSICAKLTADIEVNQNVLNGEGNLIDNGSGLEQWTPIGVYVNENLDKPFKGTFDGQGHTISGLYCEGSEISVGAISSLAGLFGSLGKNGTIKNVGVTDSYYFKAMISAGVCAMSSGTIENCWNESTVAGFEYFEDPGYSMGFAGGVCGMNTGGSIKGCRNTGKVSASGSYCFAGGVCGTSSAANENNAKIENCYNTGTVSVTGDANSYIVAGGICAGNDAGSGSAYIKNCYNTGTVLATGGAESYAGGVCGSNDGTIENCFYLEGTCGSSDEGTSKTAKEFASGEVAYLLQGEQASQVWGQTIGTDPSPVLLALLFAEEQPEKICRVTFMNADDKYAVLYANSGASLTKPADPTKDDYTFDGWFTDEDCTAAWDFDNSTVSDDLTLYAKWTEKSGGGGGSGEGGGSGGGGGGSYIPTYPPTVEVPGGGGTVTVSPSRPSTGDEVTVKPKPDTGFLVDKVTVTDKDGKPVPVTQNPDGTYSFTQPSGKVKIEVSYKPAEAPWENPYTDVSETAWYFDSVRYVSVHGLMEGYGDGRFGPDDDLSRAQLAQILYNHAGQPDPSGESSFTDVTGDAWYTDAVSWAEENGIVSGYGGGLFGPDDSITREQLAVMLYRYAGRPAVPNLILPFRDANKASAYAMDALRWAVDAGILNGKGNGILDPTGKATRAEVAAMLMRYCEAFGK